jgi:hypothetical protein
VAISFKSDSFVSMYLVDTDNWQKVLQKHLLLVCATAQPLICYNTEWYLLTVGSIIIEKSDYMVIFLCVNAIKLCQVSYSIIYQFVDVFTSSGILSLIYYTILH